MRYIIHKAVIEAAPEIEISPEAYSQFERARAVLSAALAIEEKYEILIGNYLALETRLLQIAATIDLVNLLTAARLYLDQLPQDVAECLPASPDPGELVKAQCSKEYDQHFEYRFMEALRNHVQHRGVPIHLVSHHSGWTSDGEDGRMEFTVDIVARRRYLEEDKKFKKSVLDGIAGDVDLTAACRRYVESLSAIHEWARRLVAEAASSARATVEAAHRRYAELHSGKLLGLTASAIDDEQETSSVPLLLDWDDVRLELQKRNSQLINLRKRYVTGRAMQDRK